MMGDVPHRIAHLFGWNVGIVVTKLDECGNVWVAFKCHGCGQISGRHVSYYNKFPTHPIDRPGKTRI